MTPVPAAGYSGTPLAAKLGVKPLARVALVGAPADAHEWLEPLPEGARLSRAPIPSLSQAQARRAAALESAKAPDADAAPEPEPETPSRPPFEPISRHAPRFRLILGALIGVAIGAIGATLVLVSGQGPSTGGDRWSAWKPSTDSLGNGAQEIADHVAPAYRQQGGDQLVGVTGGPLKVAASPDPCGVLHGPSTSAAAWSMRRESW